MVLNDNLDVCIQFVPIAQKKSKMFNKFANVLKSNVEGAEKNV